MNDTKADALAFLASNKTGVLSTISKEGNPHARLVYFACDEALNIYFMTMLNTRKAGDISAHPHVAFTVSTVEVPKTLQLEGLAEDVTDSPVADSTVEAIFKNLQSNGQYFAPLARMDRGDIRFYRISPTWVRFGDFTHGHGSEEVFSKIPS